MLLATSLNLLASVPVVNKNGATTTSGKFEFKVSFKILYPSFWYVEGTQ